MGWSLNGFLQSHPELRPLAAKHMNAGGTKALKDLSTMCIGDALLRYGSKRSSTWTKGGRSLSDIIRSEPEIQAVLDRQRIGTHRPAGPVRVATGVNDDLVTHGQARRLAADWCREGGDVTYKPVKLPSVGDRSLLNHFLPLLSDQGEAVDWLTARLSGEEPADSGCAELPTQP